MYESDTEYAARRLNGTVVKAVAGYLFLVDNTYRSPDGRLVHSGTNLRSNLPEYLFHSDLDLTPIPLGMVNLRTGMVYVSRKPMRRYWRQGFSEACMTVKHFSGDRGRVPYKLLEQPLENAYPTFRSALTSLKRSSSPHNSKAFSRDFGLEKIDNIVHVIYRGYRVGEVQDDVPILTPRHAFLQEHLQEVVN
jgi:hypothetical protein